MRHAFTAEEDEFASLASAQAALIDNCTRNQALIIKRAVEHFWAIKDDKTYYPNALYVASQLKNMRADTPIIVSALFGTDASARAYSIDFIREHYGHCLLYTSPSPRDS